MTSCFDPKHDISESKLVPCGNGQFWVLQTPQKPPRAPQGPQGAPGVQKWPKSSITSPVVTIDPKKQTFKGGQFFSVFSLGMTLQISLPAVQLLWQLLWQLKMQLPHLLLPPLPLKKLLLCILHHLSKGLRLGMMLFKRNSNAFFVRTLST